MGTGRNGRRFAQAEADFIRDQLASKDKLNLDYEWREPKDVEKIANRYEQISTGVDDKFGNKTLEDTARILMKEHNYNQGIKSWLENVKTDLQEMEKEPFREPKEKTLAKVEGFGRAALRNNDLEVAIENLQFVGKLDSKEVSAQLKTKLEALQNSQNKGDRDQFEKISKRLAATKEQK